MFYTAQLQSKYFIQKGKKSCRTDSLKGLEGQFQFVTMHKQLQQTALQNHYFNNSDLNVASL